jgi:hypothetical protein
MRHDEQPALQRGAESGLLCYPLCVQLGRGMPEDDQHVVSQRGDLKDARGHTIALKTEGSSGRSPHADHGSPCVE